MPRADGLAAGVRTRFSSDCQPANRGRKPSQLKAWIKENNVSSEDFIAIFTTIIATNTLEELEDMVSEERKKKLPVIVALCISAFLRDMKTGTLLATNSILDRIMGKPKQTIDIPPETLDRISMTQEERRNRIEELLKKSETKEKTKPKTTGRKRTGRTSKSAGARGT